jgi:DNA-binding NtrC family response regulator
MFPTQGSVSSGPKTETIAARPPITAILVSQSPDDVRAMEEIFGGAGWLLKTVRAMGQAVVCAGSGAVPVIVVEAAAADGRWEVLLERTADLPCPPRLIVYSRLADERLWAEVLNLGGFDVISTPFEAHEVRHCVAHALRAWRREWEANRRPAAGFSAAAPGGWLS